MKTLTEVGIRKQLQRFSDSLSHAEYDCNGKAEKIDFMKLTIEKDTLKVFIYFDETIVGEVGRVRLVDKDGDIVALAERVFVKPTAKGLYVTFRYKLVEMEVDENGI
ncbi:hypothetical protein [Paenibacillus alvei]|uniref:hypothetical protein n=1 Tax=Paenibacillus alvei TaxID=44250 RepID=UPI0013DA610E|nr:hypothetical protein [Paenibacillus alvei]NEZ45115.1 hypothetical protein [Paenibacillus alvei]